MAFMLACSYSDGKLGIHGSCDLEANAGQVEAGKRFTVGSTEHPHILSMDISRSGSEPVHRRSSYTPAYVPKPITVDQTEAKISTIGRITMVSSTSGVFVAVLDNSPCCSTLCQVSCFHNLTAIDTDTK